MSGRCHRSPLRSWAAALRLPLGINGSLCAGLRTARACWAHTPLSARAAAVSVALLLAYAGALSAQPTGCYRACPIPATSMSVSPYAACLGVRNGSSCSVCQGQQYGLSVPIVANNALSCFKACVKGYAWNPQSRECCPAPTQIPDAATAAAQAELAELIIAPGRRGGYARVREFYRSLKGRVQSAIVLRMTQSEKWTVLKRDLEAIKKSAADRGLLITELGADANQIMRAAPADTQLTEQQQALIRRAEAGPATTRVNVQVGPSPAVLEYAIVGDANCPVEPTQIALPLGGATDKTIPRASIEIGRDKAIWRGAVDDTGPPATIMWWPNGRMAGTVHDGKRLYSIRHLGSPMYTVIEMDDDRMPNEHAPTPARLRGNDPNLRDDPLVRHGDASQLRAVPEAQVRGRPRAKEEANAKQGGDIVIDVIVAYTAKAASHYRDIQRELVELAVEEGNLSFRTSGLDRIKLRLVHAYQTDYVEEGAHFEHLWRFADKGDGYMDEIHGLRNKYRGDVAILIVDDPEGCGLATRVHADAEEAFAVVHHDCAALSYSLAHEIGHIIGARHDLGVDKTATPFPYGHGYISGAKWRDIMSYKQSCGGCPRLPVWSNPNLLIKGEPAGTPDQDNARVILEEAARVAAFR